MTLVKLMNEQEAKDASIDRYRILEAIMENPDPMIRQRLEMAYDAGRVSVLHEKKIWANDEDFNCAVTFQTAFTNTEMHKVKAENQRLTAEIYTLREALASADTAEPIWGRDDVCERGLEGLQRRLRNEK